MFFIDELINWEKHAEALAHTLVIPIQNNNPPHNILPTLSLDEKNDRFQGLKSTTKALNQQTTQRERKAAYVINVGPSMFPSLDKFINNSLGQRKNIYGSVRAWTLELPTLNNIGVSNNLSCAVITYHMKGNRWCENINRSHKSNNIIWNVSIQDGTYWQSCHDPDCRIAGFRGKTQNLPDQVFSGVNDVLIEKGIDSDEDFTKALQTLDDTLTTSATGRIASNVTLSESEDDVFGSALFEAISKSPDLFP